MTRINVSKQEIELLGEEYEMCLEAGLSDTDDLFFKFKGLGWSRMTMRDCRSIMTEARRLVNNGKTVVEITIQEYD